MMIILLHPALIFRYQSQGVHVGREDKLVGRPLGHLVNICNSLNQ